MTTVSQLFLLFNLNILYLVWLSNIISVKIYHIFYALYAIKIGILFNVTPELGITSMPLTFCSPWKLLTLISAMFLKVTRYSM